MTKQLDPEQFEYAVCIAFNTGLVPVPILTFGHRLECGDHVVVFEVDGKGVGDGVSHVCSVLYVYFSLSKCISVR